jgi:hypothetical protein
MFKWLRRLRKTARRVIEDADRIVTKSIERGEPPSDNDPIAELVRIVGGSHVDDPRRRGDAGAHRTGARRAPTSSRMTTRSLLPSRHQLQ